MAKNKTIVIHRPESLESAMEEVQVGLAKKGKKAHKISANWQPTLFENDRPDAIVYVTEKEG